MEKTTQYKMPSKDGITSKEILEYYEVSENDLHRVYQGFVDICKSKSIEVLLQDLSNYREQDEGEEADHKETAIPSGNKVILESDMQEHGGILTRVYDIMHLGCGHIIQRGANKDSGLRRYGDSAYEIGRKVHVGANQQLLDDIADYEYEAGSLGVSYLKELLEVLCLQETLPENILKLYNDYVHSDLDYIINYYKTGVSTNFFEAWKHDQPKIKALNTKINFKPTEREFTDIGLVRKV